MTAERYLYVVELRRDYLATERCVFMTRAEAYAWAEARMELREVIPQANGDEHWLGQIVGDGAVLMKVPSGVKRWTASWHGYGKMLMESYFTYEDAVKAMDDRVRFYDTEIALVWTTKQASPQIPVSKVWEYALSPRKSPLLMNDIVVTGFLLEMANVGTIEDKEQS